MSHMRQEALRSFLSGEGGAREVEEEAEHLVSCARCRALAATLLKDLRATNPGLTAQGSLRTVLDLINREQQWAVEPLAAIAEWAEVRSLPSRRSQRERVRMAKTCHTIPFFKLLIDRLKDENSWEEAEFLASLALLASEAMAREGQISEARHQDQQAQVWTAVANSRRLAAEWKRAHQALANAERFVKEGSGDPRLEAEILSITASTLADQGQVAQALEALEKCRTIYDCLSEWHLLARTLVKMANVLAGTEPHKGLVALDHAAPLIPAEDSYLALLAELLRVECLIEVQRPSEALQVFRRCSQLLGASQKVRLRIRGRFTGARLLDALGSKQQAERLFKEVLDHDIEHELYKDAFLDLLYLYGRSMEAGNLEEAARICQRALTEPALSTVAHDQLRDLWSQLLEATRHQAIGKDILSDLRRYLSVHWKHPAATPPVVIVR